MVYTAEKGDSKAGIHLLLIYRLAADGSCAMSLSGK